MLLGPCRMALELPLENCNLVISCESMIDIHLAADHVPSPGYKQGKQYFGGYGDPEAPGQGGS